eukprot:CAMPEP_0174366386 /NCGR_PEP_ID=MMETSP0811_2-20130205/81037_1 /TAXON_ID=73025 ORGANISM="Eutreptiella gymnastica-like, Strain CCMP1594" /NCGR_SAMPLE_ID=MMETSP0811_2 /ASSEMBLY_ACC=CAM_ASM_000667 /LENGTH=44 /DNA_ID= /DNA_START= /DNA_END= /DNA_ORIENTATION=
MEGSWQKGPTRTHTDTPASDSPDPDKDDRGQGRHTLPAQGNAST